MNQTEKVYIQLISNSIYDEHKFIDLSEIQLEELVKLSKLHKNVGLVYSALIKQEKVPANIINIFEKGFYTEMMVYSKRTTVFQMVLEELNKNHIKHIIVKGISYANCYKQREFRTMGDMDLIISSDEIEKADKVLRKLGGQFNYECSNDKVHSYKINHTFIEIHTSIGYAGDFNTFYDYEKYFKKAIDESVCMENFTYEFSSYYKIMYAIFHTAKHFYDSGCGVRMLTDIAVLWDVYRPQIDKERLWEDLEEMKLKKFARHLFIICKKWFDIEIEGIGIDMEQMEKAEDYILSGGVFGYQQILSDTTQIVKQKGNHMVIKMFQWAFPSYSHMREHSNWFQDKPAVLLPIAYLERIVRNARERGGIVPWIESLKKGSKEKEIQRNIIDIMGLTNE